MGNVQTLLLADHGEEFVQGLLSILQICMGLFSIMMVVFAVYLFFMMYTATDEGKRKKVKSRIYHTITSLVIVITLILALRGLEIHITSQDNLGNSDKDVALPTLSDNFFKDAQYDGTLSLKLTLSYAEYLTGGLDSKDFNLSGKGSISASKIKGYDESLGLTNIEISYITIKSPCNFDGESTLSRSLSFDITKSVPGYTEGNPPVPQLKLQNVSGSKGTLPITIIVAAKLPTGDRVSGFFDAEISVTVTIDSTASQKGVKVADVIRSV